MRSEKLSLKRKPNPDLEDLKTSQEEISSKVKKAKNVASEAANVRNLRSSSKTDNGKSNPSPSKVQKAKSTPFEAGKVRILRSASKTENEKDDSSPTKNEAIIVSRSSQKSQTDSQISSPFQKMTRISSKIRNHSSKSSTVKSDKANSSSRKLQRVEKMKSRRTKQAVVVEMKHFRSSFKPVVSFLNNHNSEIPREFDEQMLNTPFGPLYKVFRDNKIKESQLKKTNSAIVKIVQQFSKKEKKFRFGNKWVQFTVEDVAFIFGLPGAGKSINLFDRNYQEKTEFVKRTWPDFDKDKHPSKIDVESVIAKVLKGKKETDKDDYVRLMVTFMVMTIFSPSSSQRISWSFFPYVEVIENLNKIAWASTIHKTLFEQLSNWNSAKPWTITGCSLSLLYFACEHINLISQIDGNEDYFPRFAKWNTTELVKALENQALDVIEDDKVNELLVNFKSEEAALLINNYENEFLDDIFEDIRETEINKLRISISSLENENANLKTELDLLKMKLNEKEEDSAEQSLQARNKSFAVSNEEGDIRKNEKYSEQNKVRDIPMTRGEKLRKESNHNIQAVNKVQTRTSKRKAEAAIVIYQPIEVDKCVSFQDSLKLQNVRRSEGWKFLNDHEKPVVESFFSTASRNTEVWKSLKADIVIHGATLESLMFNNPVSNLVIDWYSHQLQSEENPNRLRCYYFPAHTFQILSEGNEQLIQKCVSDVIKSMDAKIDYWFIPIITSLHNTTDGHHWTLLQVDTQSWEWMHYNTLLPRQSKGRKLNTDQCFKNANKMKMMLMTTMKNNWPQERFKEVNLNTNVYNANCTQQTQDPNCALYICYFMNMLSQNRQVTTDDEQTLGRKIQRLRSELVYYMLTDEETCYEVQFDE